MAPTPFDASEPQWLRRALQAGQVILVDEAGHPLSFLAARTQRCWAHLRDAQDGRTYVQQLQSSLELMNTRYRELLGQAV